MRVIGCKVVNHKGDTISMHETNAQAWRQLDRLMNEPVSKREDTADWSFTRSASRE